MSFSKEELNSFYRYSLALTQDEPLAYDLLQTSLEKWLKKKIHSEVTNTRAYFLKMIKNQFLDDLKKKWNDHDPFNDNIHDAQIGQNPLEKLMIDEDIIERAFKMMSSHEREIIFLWGVEEYTVQEVADHLGQPKGTILAKMFRLKKRVQENWNRYHKEGE